ncbi:pectinesterase family protein [Paenibacillus mucilaginosus]|uniref:pectinesterase family protein n=1 Tax=Paenibacillus mucilaginosus TaxID=61624 RepID=UPI001EE66BCC|nr:pectinesterase family protein [Paenibacillus mucilaginosus]
MVSSLLVAAMLTGTLPATAAAETGSSPLPAFPGAEGGGMYTTGGRGGEVYEVTTLADSGPGSLREAVSRSNTTVVFRVGGTIHLQSPLKITGSNLTIAGQTAPGEGITVSDYATAFEADNLIVRYMRFRLGDRHPSDDDAFGGRYHKNIIVDHCSFSWSVDEVLSMYVNENTTVQWSIVSESMLMTSHYKGRHGYAGIWGGNNASFHHNLIAHNVSRNPRFAASENHKIDSYNNVIYNWGFFSAYGGEQGMYNLRDNYYKYGPNTYRSARNQVFLGVGADTRIYIGGNYMYGNPEVTADNWKGVGDVANPESKLSSPVVMQNPPVPEPAELAYEHVLEGAGAILPRRDAVDARVVSEVVYGTGKHINSQKEVGGYLEFAQTVSTSADDDHDGMPNEWETANGLNPNEPSDRNGLHASGYTHLEVYLNGITGSGSANPAAVITQPADNTIVTEGASVEIQASASDADGSVAKVEFYRNDVLLGEDSTAPYSFTWENVQDGTHFLTVKAVDDTGTSTQSSNVAVHVNRPGSILPWQSADIGTPGIAGHTQLGATAADVTVKSAGDIDGRSDSFHFAYQQLTGNGEVIARVESVTATDDGAEAGVMIRDNLNASSKFAALLIPYVKLGKKSVTMNRMTEGGSVTKTEPEAFIQTPYWVKVVRLGDQFTSLISENGIDWSVLESVTIPMAETVYFGLAADASKPDDEVNKYNASVFSHAVVNPLDADFPAAPTGVTASAGNKSVQLNWTASTSADSYNVFRSDIPGGPYSQIAGGITAPSYTDLNLTPGKTYFYVVAAVNEKGVSFNSSEASATPEGEPETVYLVNDDFEALANETTPPGYSYLPDPQDIDHKVVVTDVPADTTGNTSGKAMIVYDNGAGGTQFIRKFAPQLGSVVIEVDITAPGWPGTSYVLQLQDESGSRTPLSIELRKPALPVADPNYTLTYKLSGSDYKLMDPPVSKRWYNLKIVTNAAAQTADIYIDQSLLADNVPFQADVKTTGIARITARTPGTGKGTLYYDNVKVYVEPVQSPKGLNALPGNGKVQLSWTAADGADYYTVKRSTTDGGPYTAVASNVTAATYIDESVQNGTTYYYVVTASGTTGESGPSNQVTVSPSEDAVKPEAPAGLTAGARSTQVDLSWQPAERANTYTVKRSTNPEGPFTVIASGLGSTSYRDGGLDNGTEYSYVVSAVGVGGEGAGSAPVAVTPSRQLSTPVVTVQSLPSGALVQWGPVDGASSYLVKRADQYGGPYEVLAESVTGVTYTDSGLINGKPYYYKVTAVDGTTHSLDSSSAGVRPSAQDGTPAPPPGLTAEPGDSSIRLNWMEVPEAASYTVKRSDTAEGPYTTAASGLSNPSFTDSGLVNGKNYYYLVSAVNEAGEGGTSVPVREVPAQVLTVAADGSAQYTKVQDAIQAVPDNSATPTIIKIKNGTYREKLDLPSAKINVRMIGESREGTVLIYGDAASTLDANGNPLGTSNSYSFRVQARDFTAEHLTIQNDAGDDAGQAVALYANGDRMAFRDVSLRGYQDTLYSNNGRQYFTDSYIEGDVDFIFGNASAVFENSIIHSLSSGYVTAASTAEGKTGYVFLNSRITAEPGLTGTVALGRPWRAYSNVKYVNSYMDDHIKPVGWDNWGRTENESTAQYGEYASYGPGADPKARFRWSKQLTTEEAALLTPADILGGSDGWNPFAAVPLVDGSRELAALTVNDAPVPDFSPATTQYRIELQDPRILPVVTAAVYSDTSLVSVKQAASVPGTAEVHIQARDGGERTYTIQFVAADHQAPTLKLEVDQPVLQADDHRMVSVHASVYASDEGTGVASIRLLSITSSEPENDQGDGNTAVDIQGAEYGTADYDFELRAERSGPGSGRIYTITYEAVDFAGNRTQASTTVTILH